MRISDWSSDVCSSDLHPFNVLNPRGLVGKILNIVKVKSDALGIAERADAPNDDVRLIIRSGIKSDVCHLASQIFEIFNASFTYFLSLDRRSDERRVGKECVSTCKSRGWLCLSKK